METIRRIDETLIPCRACSGQPKLLKRDIRGTTYALECCPCQSRTSPYATKEEAKAAWQRSQYVSISVQPVAGVEVVHKRPILARVG